MDTTNHTPWSRAGRRGDPTMQLAVSARNEPKRTVRTPRVHRSADVLVSIFLRGGMDGLSYLVPHGDADYVAARPDIAVPSSAVLPLDDTFGLHPAAAPLMDIWDSGQLAFVPASGSIDPSRSHFEAMSVMEAAVGSSDHVVNGWLGRLGEAIGAGDSHLGAVAVGRIIPRSLAGFSAAIGIADLTTFELGPLSGRSAPSRLVDAVRTMYPPGPDDLVATQGRVVLDVLGELSAAGLKGEAVPEAFGPSPVGASLWQAAQIIEADIGTRAITVDWGGWDHHDDLGTHDSGDMYDHVVPLAAALRAFWDRLVDHQPRITVVIMSEFGRRLAENANGGTDHGHGGVITVLGGGISGGIKGDWVGLGPDVLDRGDVPVLTDYRHVLAEIADRRMGAADALPDVFPEFVTGPSAYVGL